ncbi:MAG TPA: ribosome small subunit-dependent GTPase A [Woeseiaceae bacterium]
MGKDSNCEALVIATFSRRMLLRLENGKDQFARVKGKRLRPVCGDRVISRPIDNEPELLITDILPRSNELTRPDSRGRPEVLAANLSCLAIVVSAKPEPDWFITDRYLCAAELIGAHAAVIFNKIDIEPPNEQSRRVLGEYRDLGYAVFECSAKQELQLEPISDFLAAHTAILVGQSGVGKSSMINRLLGEARLKTASISDSSGEGKHTTVNSAMLFLPSGGKVIDSPGVRDFAPAIEQPESVVHGFREISLAGQHCRFANCRHLQEPGCAVKDAVDDGQISDRRYRSFRRLLTLTRQFSEARY